MRISDWSSDVCSSDLVGLKLGVCFYLFDRTLIMTLGHGLIGNVHPLCGGLEQQNQSTRKLDQHGISPDHSGRILRAGKRDRKRVVSGKSVSVRVDMGGRRIITKKKIIK